MGSEKEHTTTIIQRKPALGERFEVVSTLGEGAGSSVFRVRDRENDLKEVALKVLVNKQAFDENTLRRFHAEIDILKKIRHPHIVEAYDLIELDDTVAFTMEYVQGCDLGSIFEKEKLSFEEIDRILDQLLQALAELHANGILHRDIKLENILIRNDGELKLSDLGLMKEENTKMTRTGILLGTAQYMAPEYIKRSSYDERSDIYACGVVLYELLTKTRRLSTKVGMEAIEHLLKTKFALPKLPMEGLPPKYVHIMSKATALKPKNRFQTVDEMREAFHCLNVNEKTGVQMRSNVKFGGRAGIMKIHDFEDQANGVWKRWAFALSAIFGIATLGAVAGIYFGGDSSQKLIHLSKGVYVGQINMYGNTGFMKKVVARINQKDIAFETELSLCPHGVFDLQTHQFSCASKGLAVELEPNEDGSISGAFVSRAEDHKHTFVLKPVKK